MTKVAVTGGAGFIGSNLTKRLHSDGYDVVVIDDLSTGLLSNVDQDKSTFHQISITDPKSLATALKDCETIFHLAAREQLTYERSSVPFHQTSGSVQEQTGLAMCSCGNGLTKG